MKGIRVLDLSRIIAGPYAAMMLGDLGADVIKVERPGRGDDMRWLRGGKGMSAIFAACNRNKRGVAIDLARPEGRAAFLALAATAGLLAFLGAIGAGILRTMVPVRDLPDWIFLGSAYTAIVITIFLLRGLWTGAAMEVVGLVAKAILIATQ